MSVTGRTMETCHRRHRSGRLLVALSVVAVLACARTAAPDAGAGGTPTEALLANSPYAVVDCLLPPQLVVQGQQSRRFLPSRPAKVSSRECAQRGGAQALGIVAWTRLADDGDPEAQTYLGEMYEHGIGGAPKDVRKAIELYEKARPRSARAATNLALIHANGAPGLKPDPAKTAEAMRQAADVVAGQKTLVVVQPAVPAASPPPSPPPPDDGPPADLSRFPFGGYHALLIGNGAYRHAPRLKTPVREIDAVGALLERKYGFKVTKLKDATAEDILRRLDDLHQDLDTTDNLLVYYTGHGAQSETNEGYWIPVDGEGPDSKDRYRTARWIASSTVREKLAVMKPRHILVVADSCYSARFLQFKGSLPPPSKAVPSSAYLKTFSLLYAAKSRTALTSGGLQPVVETVDGNMSVFATAFVRFLENNRRPIESVQVFSGIASEVTRVTSEIGFPQQPQWGPISGAGHETGDFWFRPK